MNWVRLRKVTADIRLYWRRVVLAVIAIAIGATALSTALSARTVLTREVDASFQGSRPVAVTIWLDQVDDQILAAVRTQPGVSDADARRLVRARVEVSDGQWLPLLLYGVRDFADLRVSAFRGTRGSFPPPDGEIVVERSAFGVLQTELGGALRIRVPNKQVVALQVAGEVHDAAQAPGWQDHEGYAYASRETLSRLGVGDHLDELRLTLAHQADTQRVAADVGAWLERQGRIVQRVEVHKVAHPHADHMGVVLLLLMAFAVLAMLLAGSLTTTVIAALLARQGREIGALKAIGATSPQVAVLYTSFVLLLGLGGAVIGVPLGNLFAQKFITFASMQLNLAIESRAVPILTLLLELAVALVVPLVAAWFPIRRAVRSTVREALQSEGATVAPRRARDRSAVRRVEHRLAWRNLFRRRARLVATLVALALGGVALMTAINVYGGLTGVVDQAMANRGDDVEVRLLRPAPAGEVVEAVRMVPGVVTIEPWGLVLAAIELNATGDDRTVGTDRYPVSAPPLDSRLPRPRIIEGRWVEPTGAPDVVVNRGLVSRHPTLTVGGELVLRTASGRIVVRVVGVVEEVGAPGLYTNPSTMLGLIGGPGLAGSLRIVVSSGQQTPVASALEAMLADRGWFPLSIMTRDGLRAAMVDHFLIMLVLLSIAAFASVLVGALTLGASMSLNVLERSREIGVMRALGATDRRIVRLLFVEGASLVGCSVVLAIVLSLPVTALLQTMIGKHGLQVTVPFTISPYAVVAWMGISTVVTLLACYLPALRALLRSVREVIAHD
jgi:putative ABC transport system permease protein